MNESEHESPDAGESAEIIENEEGIEDEASAIAEMFSTLAGVDQSECSDRVNDSIDMAMIALARRMGRIASGDPQ
jgi:hypothetical protein